MMFLPVPFVSCGSRQASQGSDERRRGSPADSTARSGWSLRRQTDELTVPGFKKDEQEQIVPQLSRQKEVLTDALPPILSQPLRIVRLIQQVPEPVRGTFDRMSQYPGELVADLNGQAADGSGDHRLLLPDPLRHGQPEPFTNRLLQDDGGGSLNCVDFQGARGRKTEHRDVLVAAGSLLNLGEDLGPLRVVVPGPADQQKP